MYPWINLLNEENSGGNQNSAPPRTEEEKGFYVSLETARVPLLPESTVPENKPVSIPLQRKSGVQFYRS